MPSKKSSNKIPPKALSSGASGAQISSQSAVLKSAFSPSHFQLSLFASVVQALDSQQIRFHDTITGRLATEYSPPRRRVTCICWCYYGASPRNNDVQPARKRRRRLEGTNTSEDALGTAVVAIGSTHEDIELFAPLESRVVGTLRTSHIGGVQDFVVKDDGYSTEAWSLAIDGTLAQWNLTTGDRVRSFPSTIDSPSKLCLLGQGILIASNQAYLLNPDSHDAPLPFPGLQDAIHSLVSAPKAEVTSQTKVFLAAAQGSPYINVYNVSNLAIMGTLIAENEVQTLSFGSAYGPSHQQVVNPPLASISKDGKVEIFATPFDGWTASSTAKHDLKSRAQMATRRCTASIQFVRPDKSATPVPIIDTSFQQKSLLMAVSDGSTNVSFESIPWQDERGALVLTGAVMRIKAQSTGLASMSNGVKNMDSTRVDESHASVSRGDAVDEINGVNGASRLAPAVIEISSAEEESDDEDSEHEDVEEYGPESTSRAHGHQDQGESMVDGSKTNDVDMLDAHGSTVNEDAQGEEPTFGDMLRARSVGPIQVPAEDTAKGQQTLITRNGTSSAPSNLSLGTVLTQSLRTNDRTMLESCLQVEDLQIVRATIERLNSDLAISLLQRLAERLHSRPGRAGSLLVWVQWTLVAHGGYLASRPDVVRQLASLHSVVRERARSLQPLLSLKGKLDMLEAQLNLRRSLQRNTGKLGNAEQREAVVYVEGDDSESGADKAADGPLEAQQSEDGDIDGSSSIASDNLDDMEIDEDGEDDRDDESSEGSDMDGFIDDEASESGTSHDEELGDEVNYDDVDSLESGVDDVEPIKSKRSTQSTSKRGKMVL